jgi:hypothetical protein
MVNKDFYINELNILDWMNNDNIQVIRFKDRIEYRENNELNRLDGPSIEYFSPDKDDLYYINGKKITFDEFKILSKKEKMKQL